MAYNKTILVGNITRDIELKVTQTGTSVCSFTLAVNRKMQDVTDFHDCVAWGKTADTIAKYFHKGKEILVEGELQKRSWDDKDGNKRWATEVKVDSFAFTGRKDDNNASSAFSNNSFSNNSFGFVDVDEDEGLPF